MKKLILITLLMLSCTKSRNFTFTAKADEEKRILDGLENISYEQSKKDPVEFAYIFSTFEFSRKYDEPNKKYICEIIDKTLKEGLSFEKNFRNTFSFLEIFIETMLEIGNKEAIAKLKEIIINDESNRNYGLLIYSCITHDVKLVELLVNSLELDVNVFSNDRHNTALMHLFTRYFHLNKEEINNKEVEKIVKCLLDKGANVDFQNKEGDIALTMASKVLPNDLSDIFKLIADKTVNVDFGTDSEYGGYGSALSSAASECKIDYVRILLDKGAMSNVQAVVGNSTTEKNMEIKKQIFELILSKYEDNEQKKREDINKAVFDAIGWGWANQELLIKYLFENYFEYIDLNKEFSFDKRIMLIGALRGNTVAKIDQEGSLKLFKYILSKYEDKEQETEHINKAFESAIQEGWEYQELAIKYLTENYHTIISPNINSYDWNIHRKKYSLLKLLKYKMKSEEKEGKSTKDSNNLLKYLLINYPNINPNNKNKLSNKFLLGAMAAVVSAVTLNAFNTWFNVTDQ